jgi:exodeoxyribonuclease VIII
MNGHPPNLSDARIRDASRFPEAGDGIYRGVPDEAYHDLEGRASSSLLRSILTDTPAHARARAEGNTEPTEAMRLGTMLHTYVLQPEVFEDRYATPTGCRGRSGDGSPCSNRGEHPVWVEGEGAGRHLRWYCPSCRPAEGEVIEPAGRGEAEDALEALGPADVRRLSSEDRERAEAMKARLEEHPAASSLLFELDGAEELTILWTDRRTGTELKSRIDRVAEHPRLGTVAIDYKTTYNAAPGRREFGRSIAKRRYDVQAACYLEALGRSGVSADRFLIVAQERSAPHAASVQLLSPGPLLEKGRADLLRALRSYKQCRQDGEWPAYPDAIVEARVPDWHYD